jgi:hypothetical protein
MDCRSGKNYRNPILYADYSDPDAIRVGDDYYMTASSFNETPGLPILHSKDMVNWKLVNYAIQDILPKEHFSVPKEVMLFGRRQFVSIKENFTFIGAIPIWNLYGKNQRSTWKMGRTCFGNGRKRLDRFLSVLG